MTALLREAATFTPGYECNSPVAPSDFNRLISVHRITQTAIYWYTALLRPPYIGILSHSDHLTRPRKPHCIHLGRISEPIPLKTGRHTKNGGFGEMSSRFFQYLYLQILTHATKMEGLGTSCRGPSKISAHTKKSRVWEDLVKILEKDASTISAHTMKKKKEGFGRSWKPDISKISAHTTKVEGMGRSGRDFPIDRRIAWRLHSSPQPRDVGYR